MASYKNGSITLENVYGKKTYETTIAECGSANEPITITQNGTYTAPEGVGYSPINVNVPSKEEETKSITITENGTTTVLPTSGKVLSKVDIVANVPQSGGEGVPTRKEFIQKRGCEYLFYNYRGGSVDDLISYDDTSSCTSMSHMFSDCSSLRQIPRLDISKVTNMSSMFNYCVSLITIPQLDTSKVTNMNNMFRNCKFLDNIRIDLNSCTNADYMFWECTFIRKLTLLNVKTNIQIGSGTSWGDSIEKDCLIQIISELIKPSSGTRTLTMGTANKAKIADTYVKLLADDGTGKYPFEVCTSTDEGAMTIEAYCTYKNWTLA